MTSQTVLGLGLLYFNLMAKEFSSENFQKEVVENSQNKPVLVDFYAEWCGPCKVQAPIVDDLAKEMKEKAVIGKLNIENEQQIASQYNVMSIPTLIVFKDGEPQETLTGMRDKSSLKGVLEKYL